MLNFNEIKLGKILEINNDPYLVIKAQHNKVARGGAVLKTKLKNILNGNTLEKTFQGNDKVEEANVERKKANFLYKDSNQAFFMNNETYEQFSINIEEIEEQIKFLKEETEVNVLYFQNQPMSIELPIKMEFKVISAPPGVKGNSAGNVNKNVEIETGAKISVPLFINENDIIRVNTETGDYVERV
ncbi:elongation factor P [bacterium]|nr:elongation factor P [bacterium]